MTVEEPVLVVVGLIIYAAVWYAIGRRTRPHTRRKRDRRPITPAGERPQDITGDVAVGQMTPAEAMANAAPVDTIAETDRLQDNSTAPIRQDDTIMLPGVAKPLHDPLAIAEAAETLNMARPIPSSVEVWRPPEPRIVLAVTWKRDGAPLVAGRYDVTDDMPGEIVPLYHAMKHQRALVGGTIIVAVKLDGRHRDDWEWEANDNWPRQQIDALRQAREQLQQAVDA